MALRMQSSRLPTALSKMLNSKLEHIWEKHTEILKVTENIEAHVKMAEQQVNKLAVSENCTADEALTLTIEMDALLETMTKGHKVLSGESRAFRSAEMFTEVTKDQSQASKIDGSVSAISSTVPSSVGDYAPAFSMLKIQVEVLQNHMTSLQDSYETRLPELETKVKFLEEAHSETKNDLSKLQSNQVSFYLDAQLKNDQSMENVARKLARLETDVALVKDYLIQMDSNQEELGKKVSDVRHATDNLARLRDMLNHLHLNVSQREELTHKFNQLEEELTTFKCYLSPLLGEDIFNNPGGNAANPIIVP